MRSDRALTDISESPEVDDGTTNGEAEEKDSKDKLEKPVSPASEHRTKVSPVRPDLSLKQNFLAQSKVGSSTSINCSTPRAETPTTSIDMSLPRGSVSKSRKRTFRSGTGTSIQADKESHCSAMSNHSLLQDSLLDLQPDPSDDGFHHQGTTVISPLAIPTVPGTQPKDIDRKHTGRFSVSPVDGIAVCHSIKNRHDRVQTVSESSVGQSVKHSPATSRDPSVQFKMSDMSLIPDTDKQLDRAADQKPLLFDFMEDGGRSSGPLFKQYNITSA